MRGSSGDDSEGGSDDDDVLASLRGDFAEPFARTTTTPNLKDEEADEEDERLIHDCVALAGQRGGNTRDDDMDDDALAEEALVLAGNGGVGGDANARHWEEEDDEDFSSDEDEEEEERRPEDMSHKTLVTTRRNEDRYVPAPAPGSGSRALRAYQTARGGTPGLALASTSSVKKQTPNEKNGFNAGALPSWARPPLQRALAGDSVTEDDVADALRANWQLQKSVRKVIEEVEGNLIANSECVFELRDALRLRRAAARDGAGFFGNGKGRFGGNGHGTGIDQTYHTYQDELAGMKPGTYFRPKVFGGTVRDEKSSRRNASDKDGPPPNRDASRPEWVKIRTAVPVTFKDWKPWSTEDDVRLKTGVHHFTQRARIFSREKMTLSEVAGAGTSSLEDLLDKSSGIAGVVQDANSIDWHEVRRNHLPRRDPTDCRLRWQNCRDPRLEQSAFSDDEDDRLVVCAKKFGERNWEKIADALNVSNANADTATQKHKKRGLRSATQCAGRYQAFLNPTLVRSTWTPEEDAALKEFVQKKGVGRWAEAALSLPGHTHAQCLHRWGKVLCPGRRKGAWVCEEDDALRFAVAAHQRVYGRQKGPFVSPEPERLPSSSGQNAPSLAVVAPPNPHTVDSLPPPLPWSKIAAHVATRTDVQCRERWTNVLDRTVFVWTAAADTALREAVAFHATTTRQVGLPPDAVDANETSVGWAQVSRQIATHGFNCTDKLCRNRFIVLSRQDGKRRRGEDNKQAKVLAVAKKAAVKAAARETKKKEAKAAKARGVVGKVSKKRKSDVQESGADVSLDGTAPLGKRRG